MFYEFTSVTEIFAVSFVGCLCMHCVLLSLNPAAVTVKMMGMFKIPAIIVTWVTINLLFYHLRPGEINPRVFTAIKIGYALTVVPYMYYFWGYVSDKSLEYMLLMKPELRKYIRK